MIFTMRIEKPSFKTKDRNRRLFFVRVILVGMTVFELKS